MWLIWLLLALPIAAQEPREEDPAVQLTKVRRIFVDSLTGGNSALKIRDLLMSSLQASKLFIITEDEERADAFLKGAADDTTFTDQFSSSDGINAHANVTTPGSQSTGSRYSSRTVAGLGIGENESHKTEERKHEAIATVRLVNKAGDVIWSTTQESLGGKFLGAAADVADKVAKRLVADYRSAKKQGAPLPAK